MTRLTKDFTSRSAHCTKRLIRKNTHREYIAAMMSTSQTLPPIHQHQRRRVLEISLAALLALTIALIFWSQQHYPALLKKLHAGQGVQVKGAISFDALLKNTAGMPAPRSASPPLPRLEAPSPASSSC